MSNSHDKGYNHSKKAGNRGDVKGCGMLLSDNLATLLEEREKELAELAGSMGWKLYHFHCITGLNY